jgi:hypothetical protein
VDWGWDTGRCYQLPGACPCRYTHIHTHTHLPTTEMASDILRPSKPLALASFAALGVQVRGGFVVLCVWGGYVGVWVGMCVCRGVAHIA